MLGVGVKAGRVVFLGREHRFVDGGDEEDEEADQREAGADDADDETPADLEFVAPADLHAVDSHPDSVTQDWNRETAGIYYCMSANCL